MFNKIYRFGYKRANNPEEQDIIEENYKETKSNEYVDPFTKMAEEKQRRVDKEDVKQKKNKAGAKLQRARLQ